MDFNYIPPLGHIALVKIVSSLWNQKDIKNLIMKCDDLFVRRNWQELCNKVKEKASQLPLPTPLKEKTLGAVYPMGLEVLKWIECHNSEMGFSLQGYLHELFWTQQGTLDRIKTTEPLIRNQNLSITERFQLACHYCLENDIMELWVKMPQNDRLVLYKERHEPIWMNTLVTFWAYYIRGEVIELCDAERKNFCEDNPIGCGFEIAEVNDNKIATEYFWNKLFPEKKKDKLEKGVFLFYSEHFDVFCFLFSQMNSAQQMLALKESAFELMKCLLDWPWQSLFMEVTYHLWDFLKYEEFYWLLREVVVKMKNGSNDFDYQSLFEKFWVQSPMTHRKHVVGELTRGSLLSDMFKIKDVNNISLIFKAATPEEKKYIFQSTYAGICEDLVYSKEWSLLKFFISECLASQEEVVAFKDECKKNNKWSLYNEKEDVIKEFYELLDDLSRKEDKKRNADEKYCVPFKKLRSSLDE